jgi:hypothetical protein
MPGVQAAAVPTAAAALRGSIAAARNEWESQAVCWHNASSPALVATLWFTEAEGGACSLASAGCWDVGVHSSPNDRGFPVMLVGGDGGRSLRVVAANPHLDAGNASLLVSGQWWASSGGAAEQACSAFNATHSLVSFAFPGGLAAGSSVAVVCQQAGRGFSL